MELITAPPDAPGAEPSLSGTAQGAGSQECCAAAGEAAAVTTPVAGEPASAAQPPRGRHRGSGCVKRASVRQKAQFFEALIRSNTDTLVRVRAGLQLGSELQHCPVALGFLLTRAVCGTPCSSLTAAGFNALRLGHLCARSVLLLEMTTTLSLTWTAQMPRARGRSGRTIRRCSWCCACRGHASSPPAAAPATRSMAAQKTWQR